MSKFSKFKNIFSPILSGLIFAGLFFIVFFAFASTPINNPGDTPNPLCTPSNPNCSPNPGIYNFGATNFLGTGNFTTTGTITAGTIKVGSAYTFPTTDGKANQILKTNGAGVLSWANASNSETGTAWGTITGTLSDQTDLIGASGYLNQHLRTTDSPTFAGLNLSSLLRSSATDGTTTTGIQVVDKTLGYGSWLTPGSLEGITVDGNGAFTGYNDLYLNYWSQKKIYFGQNDNYIDPSNGNVSFLGTANLGSVNISSIKVGKSTFDGDTLAFTNVSPAAAPTLALKSGVGIDAGVHTYSVSYITAIGHTHLEYHASVTHATPNFQTTLTVPISSDKRVTARKIYRTKAGGSTYYYLTTINNNTTTNYVDSAADSTLTDGPGENLRDTTTAQIIIDGEPYGFLSQASVALGDDNLTSLTWSV